MNNGTLRWKRQFHTQLYCFQTFFNSNRVQRLILRFIADFEEIDSLIIIPINSIDIRLITVLH